MKLSRLFLIVFAFALLVACGKPQSEAERNAQIEREIQQRLAAERQAGEQERLAQQQAELDAREKALTEKEAASSVRRNAPTSAATARATPRSESRVSSVDRTEARSYDTFYRKLEPYGAWRETNDYGYVWQPREAQRRDWRPYTDGGWAYTDAGWTWISQEPFGWATYHYGRWSRLTGVGWVWVPGEEWAPAWVSWRTSEQHVGWAPLPPEARFERRTGIKKWADSYYDIDAGEYVFIPNEDIGDENVRRAVIPPERNITIVNETTNVTNITYNNTTIVNEGPDYNELRARSREPFERKRIERMYNVDEVQAPQPVVRGETVAMMTPLFSARAVERPRTVGAPITQVTVERATVNQPDAERVRAKMRAEATPPPDAPPKKFAKPEVAASSLTPVPTVSAISTQAATEPTTGTPIATSSPTASPSPRFVSTATPTPLPVASATGIPSPRVAATGSRAPTAAAAAVASPTATPSPRMVASATPTPTVLPVASATATPSPRVAATPTPRPAASAVASPTATPSPRAIATPTLTPIVPPVVPPAPAATTPPMASPILAPSVTPRRASAFPPAPIVTPSPSPAPTAAVDPASPSAEEQRPLFEKVREEREKDRRRQPGAGAYVSPTPSATIRPVIPPDRTTEPDITPADGSPPLSSGTGVDARGRAAAAKAEQWRKQQELREEKLRDISRSGAKNTPTPGVSPREGAPVAGAEQSAAPIATDASEITARPTRRLPAMPPETVPPPAGRKAPPIATPPAPQGSIAPTPTPSAAHAIMTPAPSDVPVVSPTPTPSPRGKKSKRPLGAGADTDVAQPEESPSGSNEP